MSATGRDAATFRRWWAAAGPWCFGAAATIDAEAAWQRASWQTSARLVLALWREGWVRGEITDDRLRVPVLGIELPISGDGAFALWRPRVTSHAATSLADPGTLWRRAVEHFAVPIDPIAAACVHAELVDSAFNLALAEAAAQARPRWVEHARADPRAHDPEHHVTIGHPWHPMTKSRIGLGLAEHARIAPELAAIAIVTAVDVPRDRVQSTATVGDALAPAFGRAARDHVRIPVLEMQLARLRRDGVLARVDARPTDVRLEARSLASLRTVALPDGTHLKLALDVLTTSARRVVSPMSVANAPTITALLDRIAERDPIVRRLRIVAERDAAGLLVDRAGRDAGRLGAIVRDADHFAAGSDSVVWIAAGLGAVDPHRHARRIVAAAAGYDGEPRTRARAVLDAFATGLIAPAVRLLTAYGIALEVHQQNTLVEITRGRITGFRIRDLGGIRIHRDRLHSAGEPVALAPGSFTITDDLAETQSKLVHTLVHAQLVALVGWLHEDFGLDPSEAWASVRDALVASWDAWSREPVLRTACEADRAVFLAAQHRAKALLTMRIRDASSEYSYVDVTNVLR